MRGNLIITVADYFAQGRSETRYFVKDELRPGRIFEVHFTTEPSGATTGTSVAAQGRISGTLLEDAEIISPTRSPRTKTGLPTIMYAQVSMQISRRPLPGAPRSTFGLEGPARLSLQLTIHGAAHFPTVKVMFPVFARRKSYDHAACSYKYQM